MLEIKQLNKTINGKKIIDHVSLQVPQGSIAVLLGSSGVGKSTLLRVLNNLETADSGAVLFNGKQLDLKTIHTSHIVGMVFQHFNLFDHLTIEQNITLPLEKILNKSPEQAQNIAHTYLKTYGLLEKAHSYPSQLSGGQKQRLALARTLALEAKIICLDEPTSALDPILTTQVAKSITQLAQQGYTVLIATHDTSLLEKLSCMIYLMKDGNIIESAESQQFCADQAQYPKIHQFVSGIDQ